MDENKNRIPKDKDGDDDHADHQKDVSPMNEEPGVKNDEKKSSDQPTQGADEGTSGGSMFGNRGLGSQRMPLMTDPRANIRVTQKGRFTVTEVMRNEMNPGVGSSVGGSGSVDHTRNIEVTRKGRFTIYTELVRTLMNQGAGSSVGGSGGCDHTRNVGSSVSGEGDQTMLDRQGIDFGPVVQKGGLSDQYSVPSPSVNPMPRSGDQDNMERRRNAKRNVRSGDDPHSGGIGEASHGDESEDDMEVDHDEGPSIPRDAKRAKK